MVGSLGARVCPGRRSGPGPSTFDGPLATPLWPFDSEPRGHHVRGERAPPPRSARAHARRGPRNPDGGFPVARAGQSGDRADDDRRPRASATRRGTALARAAAARRRRLRRARRTARRPDDGRPLPRSRCHPPRRGGRSAYAVAHRGLPLPNAADPKRRTAWGWTNDARSLVGPTARVLIGVNALTPSDAATQREAVELLVSRQCADGGWNFGNASVYDVDLRGYAQTTAFGLIALQHGHAPVVARAFGFLAAQLAGRTGRSDRRAGDRGATAAWLRRRRSRARRCPRDDRPASVLPREAACRRLGDARRRP